MEDEPTSDSTKSSANDEGGDTETAAAAAADESTAATITDTTEGDDESKSSSSSSGDDTDTNTDFRSASGASFLANDATNFLESTAAIALEGLPTNLRVYSSKLERKSCREEWQGRGA